MGKWVIKWIKKKKKAKNTRTNLFSVGKIPFCIAALCSGNK